MRARGRDPGRLGRRPGRFARCPRGGRPSGSVRSSSGGGTFVMGESVEEPEEKETGSHLCLVPCPRCTGAGSKGGACHLREGHAERHECNAVGGEVHSWK